MNYELVMNTSAEAGTADHHRLVVAASDAPVPGNGGKIELASVPFQEDTDLRVRATESTSGRQPATLEAALPVIVRADPDRDVKPCPAAIVDFGAARAVRIDKPQIGVHYHAFLHRLNDSDYAQGEHSGPGLASVQVTGQDAIVRLGELPPPDQANIPAGFEAVTDTWRRGEGNSLSLTLPVATVDAVVAVAARKQHATRDGTIESAVWLKQPAILLVRPNPSPELTLCVTLVDGKTDGTLAVVGGQPGMFYELRLFGTETLIGPPAYVHKPNELVSSVYKGIGQLKINLDFVVTRDGQPPLPPLLHTDPITVGTTLTVRAISAQTRVSADLVSHATIASLPSFQVEPANGGDGETVHLTIDESRKDDSYVLVVDGVQVGQPQDGNGGKLTLEVVTPHRGAKLELAATSQPSMREGKLPIRVERRAGFQIEDGST